MSVEEVSRLGRGRRAVQVNVQLIVGGPAREVLLREIAGCGLGYV